MSKIPAAPVELVTQANAMCDCTHVPPTPARGGRRGRLRAQPSGSPGLEHVTSIMRGITAERRRVDQLANGALGTLAGGAEGLPPTLTVEEAGRLLGISRTAAYRAVKRGELPVVHLSGRLHVPTAKLLRLLGIEHPCDGPGRGTS